MAGPANDVLVWSSMSAANLAKSQFPLNGFATFQTNGGRKSQGEAHIKARLLALGGNSLSIRLDI